MANLKKHVPLIVRIIISALFLLSAVAKLFPIWAFEKQLVDLGIVDWCSAPYLARLIIALEVAIAIGILQNHFIKSFVIPVTILLLAAFCIHLGIQMVEHGAMNGNCGCFGQLIPMTPLEATIKNIITIGLLIYLYKNVSEKEKGQNKFIVILFIYFFSAFLMFFSFPFCPCAKEDKVSTSPPVTLIPDSANAVSDTFVNAIENTDTVKNEIKKNDTAKSVVAIVVEPKVLLLDEPLGALDLKLREQMQIELKQLQRQLAITFVFVTHDQEEALTLSDRIAVFNKGKIEQLGTPQELYERPKSEFVADFVGTSNIFNEEAAKTLFGKKGRFALRPEKVFVSDKKKAGSLQGVVSEVIYLGSFTRLIVDVAGIHIKATVPADVFHRDQTVQINMSTADLVAL